MRTHWPIVAAALFGACSGEGTNSPTAPANTSPAPAIPQVDTADMEAPVRELLDRRIAAVEADPTSARTWAGLGFALDAHLLLEEAEACLRRAVELDGTAFDAAYDFAFVGTLLPRTIDDLSARFERAAALRPDYAPVFARHGDALLEAGDAAAAAGRFETALAVFDRYDYARLGLARALLEGEGDAQVQRAVSLLAPIFEAFPGDPAVATAYGRALTMTGAIERAASVAEDHAAALAASNESRVPVMDSLRAEILALSRTAAASYQRGERNLRQNDLAGAAVEFERVLEADPENRTARLMLAKVLVGLRRLPEARTQLAALLSSDAGDADAHAVMGQLDTEAGRLDEALAHFNKASRVLTLDELTYRAWVTALGAKGRWDEALFRLDEWEASAPGNDDTPYLRALALSNANRPTEARSALEFAITRAPEHPMRAQLEPRILGR